MEGDTKEELYEQIEGHLSGENLSEAQKLLDEIKERDAQWYYLQALVFRKKRWYLESKKTIERALKFDPDNERYLAEKQELEKLTAESTAEEKKRAKQEKRQEMGGACGELCCECGGYCACEMCCESICEGCG